MAGTVALQILSRGARGEQQAPGRHLVALQSRSDAVRREWFNFSGVVPASHAIGQHRV